MANDIVTTIPHLEVQDEATNTILDTIVEIVEIRENMRGDPRDQLVTWGELEDMGIATLSDDNELSVGTGGTEDGTYDYTGPVGTDGDTTEDGTYDYTGPGGTEPPDNPCKNDCSTPPKVTGLDAMGGFTRIIVSWDDPTNAFQ